MDIQLKKINLFYNKHQVLHDVELCCEKGETLVILGPSGAGKSSFLRILNLLEIPKTGELNIVGYSFDFSQTISTKQIQLLRQNVGMVFQQYNLWPHCTVLQNLIEAPCKVLKMSKTDAKEKAMLLLDRLQLFSLQKRYPSQLSGGQQQRVAIARALMMEPKVLLFDEPTAALDPEITSQFAEIINELAETKITQVIVTHDIGFAKRVASQVVYMEQGRIIEQGNASRFLQPESNEFKNYLSHHQS